MRTYTLTVFQQTGETLMDESFQAKTDQEAQKIGKKKLKQQGFIDHTHRCVSPEAKLLLFHR